MLPPLRPSVLLVDDDTTLLSVLARRFTREGFEVVTATAGSAHVVFCRIGGWVVIPSHGSKPTCGFIRVPKMTAATATDVATVDEKIVR